MDKLVETKRERFWNREACQRDQWVKQQAAGLKPGSRVLDAGAGASKYRPFFSHCHYETQDFCQYQGPLVKYREPINHVCDVAKIPLPDASLDAVLCTEVLEHVPDPMAVVEEFGRLLKPGGRLFLSAPQGSNVHMEPYHYYGGFTRFWYEHWLPKKGFKVDGVAPQGGPGRTAIIYLQAYYQSWRTWEVNQRGAKRMVSLACRMLVAKVPVHYVLAWLLPKFDRYLPRDVVCIGHMVTATRTAGGGRQTTP